MIKTVLIWLWYLISFIKSCWLTSANSSCKLASACSLFYSFSLWQNCRLPVQTWSLICLLHMTNNGRIFNLTRHLHTGHGSLDIQTWYNKNQSGCFFGWKFYFILFYFFQKVKFKFQKWSIITGIINFQNSKISRKSSSFLYFIQLGSSQKYRRIF
jgi:hypothetical protein